MTALLLASTSILSACQEDPEQAANAMFITATQIAEAAEQITGRTEKDLTQRGKLTEEALVEFDKIVANYPQSSVAVKIVSEGKVGNVDITHLKAGLSDIKIELGCFTERAKCLALSVKKKFDGVAFSGEVSTSSISSQVAAIYALAGMTTDFETALATITDTKHRASALMMADSLDEALETLGELSAENASIATFLAQKYLEAGQMEQAGKLAADLLVLVDPQPDKAYDDSWEVLAEVLAETGQREKALQILEASLTAGENSEEYIRFSAVSGGLAMMVQAGFSEEAKKNSYRLKALYEADGEDSSVALARMTCALKDIGDVAESEEFLASVRQKFQQPTIDESDPWAVNWLIHCDIREPFVISKAEKIIADPTAYAVNFEEDKQLLVSRLNWLLGNKEAAIAALGDAIELHEIDLERAYESFGVLNQVQFILAELKKTN